MGALKLGMLGGGVNSAVGRCHQISSRLDGRWELVAGCFSRNLDVNERTGRMWGLDSTRVYGDWSEFAEAEQGRVDAILVATPTPQHFEQIRVLMGLGHDVISEKALATSSEEAIALRNDAEALNRFLRVTMNYSGYPMVRELRRMIKDGALGEVIGIHVQMPQEGFLRQDSLGRQVMPQEWRQRDDRVPTVSLDLGTHTHHLITFLLEANPYKVVGTESHHGKVPDVADYVSSLAKMPSGADVNMWFGKCVLGSRNGLAVDVYGELASARWVQEQSEYLQVADVAGNITILDRASPGIAEASKDRYMRFKAGHPAGFLEAFGNLYWDLADDLESWRLGTQESSFTFGADQAADGLAMLEAIGRSTTSASWEAVQESGAGRG